jgi:Kef-type K+ transport system membrane component KefB
VLGDGHVVLLFAGITGIAIAGKVVGCGLGSFGMGARSMLVIGVGMVPRGEIGFAVASIGLSLGVVSGDVFAVIVLMSIVTALLAPMVLKVLLTSQASAP